MEEPDVCVLLVEDEPLIREIMTETLEEAGHEVAGARTGDEAMELIRSSPKRFVALVTDFHMPGSFDGAEVAACLRKRVPDIPVVIASGRPEVFKPAWRTELGYRLLRKPYGPRQLIALLEQLLAAAAQPASLGCLPERR